MATATPDAPSTLKETADREADAVDEELAAQEDTQAGDPFPMSRPGEQGAATQEDASDRYEPPEEPTQQDMDLAGEKWTQLQQGSMSIQDVVDALIAVVDLHPRLRTPEVFGSDADDREIYHPADNVAEMARFLCRATPKLDVRFNNVVFYFIDREKWLKAGQRVPGAVKDFDKFHEEHSGGTRHAVIVNYHYFKAMNPRQKVFHVYRLLRSRDSTGAKRAPDFFGYFEEPGLFGAGVHEEMVEMARAFVQDAPAHANDPHQLSILAGVYEED